MRMAREGNAESGGDCGRPATRGASSSSSVAPRRSQRQPAAAASDDALQSLVEAMEQMQNAMRAMQMKMERTDEAVRIVARGLDDMVPMLGSIVRRMNTLEQRQDEEPRQGATIVIADGTYPPSMTVYPKEAANADRPISAPKQFSRTSLPASQAEACGAPKARSKSSSKDISPSQDANNSVNVTSALPSASCTYPNAQGVRDSIATVHRSVPCVRPLNSPTRAPSNIGPPGRPSGNRRQIAPQPIQPAPITGNLHAKTPTEGFVASGNAPLRPIVTVTHCSIPSVPTQQRTFIGNFANFQPSAQHDKQQAVEGQRPPNNAVPLSGYADGSQNVFPGSKTRVEGLHMLRRPYSQPNTPNDTRLQYAPDNGPQNFPRQSSSNVNTSSKVLPRNMAVSNPGLHPGNTHGASSSGCVPTLLNAPNAMSVSQAYHPRSQPCGLGDLSNGPVRQPNAVVSQAAPNLGAPNPAQRPFAPVCRLPIALPRTLAGTMFSNVVGQGAPRGNAPSLPPSRSSLEPRPPSRATPLLRDTTCPPSVPLMAANAAIEHLNRLTVPSKSNVAVRQNILEPSSSPSNKATSQTKQEERPQNKDSSTSSDCSSRGRAQPKNTSLADSMPRLGHRLLKAARQGRTKDLERLLEAGADVNMSTVGNCTPLHRAAAKAQAGAVAILIKKGANVNARDCYGRTPLHMAAYNDPGCHCIPLFIDAKCDFEIRDRSGRTPLHSAAKCGNVAAVRALIAAGANKAAKDNKGRTPFDVAKADLVRCTLPPSHAEKCGG